jgi:hypothetical protein
MIGKAISFEVFLYWFERVEIFLECKDRSRMEID